MNDPIRVAMIIQRYYPYVGGAESILGSLAPLLQAKNIEVHVLTRRYRGLASFEIIHGIPVHRLPIPGPVAMASIVFTLTALPLLRRLRPHILHAHEVFSPATTAIAAKRLYNIPVIVTAHRSGELGDIQVLKRRAFGAGRLASIQKNVDAFVCISQEIDQELAGVNIPPERRFFIPNGVDTSRFTPLSIEDKHARRHSLGLADGPIVVFSGRLASEKRVHHLLAVWPAVRAAHPHALLLILGTGEEEAALKQSAGAGVQFVGRVDDVVPYLQAADLFVLPSVAEGLSVAMLEAMATGLPALVTEVGGAPEVIDHGQNGWLIPPDNIAALQEGLMTLLGDAVYRASLAQQGRKRIVQNYALPIIAERLRALYDHLLEKQFETKAYHPQHKTESSKSGTRRGWI